MDSISAQLAEISPELADRVQSEIENGINSLTEFPSRYALAPEAKTLGRQVRQLIAGKYPVQYLVYTETVSILRIRHTAQAPLKADELN